MDEIKKIWNFGIFYENILKYVNKIKSVNGFR